MESALAIERFEDWPARLMAAIDAASKKPFQWGENDCMLFGADIVLAMTGHDYMAAYRGKYLTSGGAMRMLRFYGYASIYEAVSAGLGEPLGSVFFAQRGDVVLYGDKEWKHGMGICMGEDIAAMAKDGLTYLPMPMAAVAWRI